MLTPKTFNSLIPENCAGISTQNYRIFLIFATLNRRYSKMELAEALRCTYPVTDKTINMLLDVAKLVPVKKKEAIVEQGKRTNHIFFVKEGLFRVAYECEGKEDTICFGLDGDPFTSMHSLHKNEPAQFSCIALIDSVVYKISFSDIYRIMNENHDLAFWMNNLLVEQVYAFERRYIFLSNFDAPTRYEQFIKMRPELFNRIPMKYLAQYLKMQPETISRIRAKITKP